MTARTDRTALFGVSALLALPYSTNIFPLNVQHAASLKSKIEMQCLVLHADMWFSVSHWLLTLSIQYWMREHHPGVITGKWTGERSYIQTLQ